MAKGKEGKPNQKKLWGKTPKSVELRKDEEDQKPKDGLLYLFVALARRASEKGKNLKAIKYLPELFLKDEISKQKRKDKKKLKKETTKKKK